MIDFSVLTYGDYIYPMEATILGSIIALSSIAMVPIVGIYKICQLSGSIEEVTENSSPIFTEIKNEVFMYFIQRVRFLLQPSSDWGPALQVHRIEAAAPTHTDSQVPLAASNSNCKCSVSCPLSPSTKISFY